MPKAPDQSNPEHPKIATPEGGADAQRPPALGLVSLKQVARSSGPDWFQAETQVLRVGRLRRSVLTSSRLTQESHQKAAQRFKVAMLTLTYREGVEWSPDQLKGFTHRLRQWAARRGIAIPYVWVAELTKAGRVHYHFALWLPKGITIPKPDNRGWWPHGSTRIEWARHAVGYLAKYISKAEKAAQFPKGLRLHGRGQLPRETLPELRWWMLPLYVRDGVEIGERVVRAPGGYVSTVTGEIFESGWGFAGAGGGLVRFVRKPSKFPTPEPPP